MALTIRPINAVDAATCGMIGHEAHKAISSMHGYPSEQPTEIFGISLVERLIKNPHSFGFVAEKDLKVVGSVFVHDFDPVAVIGPLTVHPLAEGGVGKRLMEEALVQAKKLDRQMVRLVQSPSHLRSFALYTKLGFALQEPLFLMQGKPMAGTRRTSAIDAVRKLSESDIEPCNELCKSVHGFSRQMELRQAVERGGASVIERNGQVVAYAAGIGLFGHAVAKTNSDLKSLIATAPQIEGPGFFVPARNSEVLGWLLDEGFKISWPANLMTIGSYQEPRVPFLPSLAF